VIGELVGYTNVQRFESYEGQMFYEPNAAFQSTLVQYKILKFNYLI
jgi:hypothetical protein